LNYKDSLPLPGSGESSAGSLLLLEPRSRQVFSSRERAGLAMERHGFSLVCRTGIGDRVLEPWYRAQAVCI
jgi:hypothetical protein